MKDSPSPSWLLVRDVPGLMHLCSTQLEVEECAYISILSLKAQDPLSGDADSDFPNRRPTLAIYWASPILFWIGVLEGRTKTNRKRGKLIPYSHRAQMDSNSNQFHRVLGSANPTVKDKDAVGLRWCSVSGCHWFARLRAFSGIWRWIEEVGNEVVKGT